MWLVQPNSTATLFATLPFVQTFESAVDNVKKRLYVSDPGGIGPHEGNGHPRHSQLTLTDFDLLRLPLSDTDGFPFASLRR